MGWGWIIRPSGRGRGDVLHGRAFDSSHSHEFREVLWHGRIQRSSGLGLYEALWGHLISRSDYCVVTCSVLGGSSTPQESQTLRSESVSRFMRKWCQQLAVEGGERCFPRPGLSAFLCKWPVSYTGSRPGKTIAKWFRAVGQSCTGRVHRSLAFMMAR